MAVDLMQPVERIKRSATRRRSPQGVPAPITETPREKKIYVRRFSTSFARLVHMFSTRRSDSDGCGGKTRGYNKGPRTSFVIARLILLAVLSLAVPGAAAAAEAMLFQLYLTDGTSIVSYGEFARAGDRVVFSMVMGGTDQPRLHATTLPVGAVDWARTDLHAASTRYQWYAQA